MKKFVFAAICLLGLNLFCSCEKEPMLTLDPPELLLFDSNSGSQTLCITTNRDWYISSSESWCKVSQESGKASDITSFNVTITCDANTSYDDRTSIITVYAESLIQKTIVKQTKTGVLFVEQTEYTVSEEEQTLEIKVTSNISYEVIIDASCKGWISLVKTKSLSDKVIALKIEKNEGPERTGKIRISDGTLYEDISITQIPLVFVEFEDAYFKDYCVKNFDKNGDGEISTGEAEDVTEIEIGTSNVSSLVGIEYFINLTDLTCNLDWARATMSLIGDSLIVNTYFDEQGNEITSKLRSLDISKNTKLSYLSCSYNQLSSLDVSNNLELEYLLCDENQLRELNLGNKPDLIGLWCYSNQLSSLDISNCPALAYLNCWDNQIPELNLYNNIDLQYVHCTRNQLSYLDISNGTSIVELSCGYNPLTELKIGNQPDLINLDCNKSKLTSLDVSNCPELSELICERNRLSSLDVSNNTKLFKIDCAQNQLTSLDVSNNKNLTNILCGDNQLTSLDISSNSALESIWCDGNQLISIDVSNNTKLEVFGCSNNQLTSLDLSNNLALTYVVCNENPYLTEIWLKQGQKFSESFIYDKDVATIKYKE